MLLKEVNTIIRLFMTNIILDVVTPVRMNCETAKGTVLLVLCDEFYTSVLKPLYPPSV